MKKPERSGFFFESVLCPSASLPGSCYRDGEAGALDVDEKCFSRGRENPTRKFTLVSDIFA